MLRVHRGLATLAAAAVGVIFASGSASAAGTWQPGRYLGESNWYCSASKTHSVSDHVQYRGCLVTNRSGGAQIALIATLNTSKAVDISGALSSNFGSSALCTKERYLGQYSLICYAPTRPVGVCDTLTGKTSMIVNGVSNETQTGTRSRPAACDNG
ncbi:hypothetical protein OG883_26480 [Streptomyces sp. NBC_01142]|uniref:hypothetical protein n=1 Tax=Streptomyces sp. NBC_01142 TaxID=2975865 RepID=UPI002252605D|nr:hypothetical protein [Streptomyces sp. NBC_01142]MCX4823364.1 hypothetical protein [Streptomyces sp. NBC_01142]